MYRLRRIPALFIFALVSLLYCSQVCIAAGHVHATVSVARSDANTAAATPCHSPSSVPQNTGDQCSHCSDHFFLTSMSSSTDALTTGKTVCSTISLCVYAISSPKILSSSYREKSKKLGSPSSLYLSLSVLRL